MILDIILDIGLYHYLFLALILFCIGLFGVIVCRNLLKILICVELMLNAVGINFIAFATFSDAIALNGLVFSLFIILIGATEVAVGVAILISIYKYKQTVDGEKMGELKG